MASYKRVKELIHDSQFTIQEVKTEDDENRITSYNVCYTKLLREHGVTLAKYLFGESFFEKVEAKEKTQVVKPLEQIKIKLGPDFAKASTGKKGKHWVKEIRAKVDTGAFRSSIDKSFAESLGLLDESKILYYRHYRSSLGKHRDRPVVGLTFWFV